MITRGDLVIFKPELLGNRDEAGGQRSPIVVESGKIQELFTPISDIEHAQSAINIVKCYPALDTAGTEKLVGAHVFINQPPVDPKVSVIIVESETLNDASRVSDMKDMLESAVNAGQLINNAGPGFLVYQDTFPRSYLSMSDGVGGQTTTQLVLGQIIVISIEYTGNESATYPRRQHFAKVINTNLPGVTGGSIQFEPAMAFETPGPTVSINSQTNCTKIRQITTADPIKYHGVTKLTATTAANSVTLPVTNTKQQIVPAVYVQNDNNGLTLKTKDEIGLIQKFYSVNATSSLVYYLQVIDDFNSQHAHINKTPTLFYTDENGMLRTDGTWAYSGSVFTPSNVTLGKKPKVGTKVVMGYLPADRYSDFTGNTAPPANNSVVRNSLDASVIYNSIRLKAYEKPDGMYIYQNAWIFVGTYDYSTNVFTPASGSFTGWQVKGLFQNNALSITTYQFPIAVNNPKLDSIYIAAYTTGEVLITGSSNLAGNISGAGITGTISDILATVNFSSGVDLGTLYYNATEFYKTLPPAEIFGLDPLRIPNDGLIPIFEKWGVVAVQHTQYQVVTSPAPGQTKTIRANTRFVDITDATNKSLWTPTDTNFSVNLATNTVTINSNFAGFTAPFTLSETIGELGLITTVNDESLVLAAGLTREYPLNSTVSSVLSLDDLQAYVGPVRDMSGWSGNWDNDGTPAVGNLNVAAYPIEVTNDGAINEDWAIIFVTATAFRLVGRNVGQVATGDTLNDFSPMNALVGKPYFIIRQEAFGGGWNPGEAIRFFTFAAAKPVMLVRVVESGHSNITNDRTLISFRGNEE